jgi:hypothetical protein
MCTQSQRKSSLRGVDCGEWLKEHLKITLIARFIKINFFLLKTLIMKSDYKKPITYVNYLHRRQIKMFSPLDQNARLDDSFSRHSWRNRRNVFFFKSPIHTIETSQKELISECRWEAKNRKWANCCEASELKPVKQQILVSGWKLPWIHSIDLFPVPLSFKSVPPTRLKQKSLTNQKRTKLNSNSMFVCLRGSLSHICLLIKISGESYKLLIIKSFRM